jgi:hypothetical protein
VVDAVASAVGFWPALVEPVLRRCIKDQPGDLLGSFRAARSMLAPEASLEASFRAFIRYHPHPALLLYADYDSNKAERGQGELARSWALRAKTIIPSPSAAAAGLYIPSSYRIPAHSVIQEARTSGTPLGQDDRLGRWTSSSGGQLRDLPVRVVAHRGWACVELR